MNNKAEDDKTKLVKSLIEISVAENEYMVDLEITDRYQNFSAELLRVSLLCVGVFGFLLKEIVLSQETGGSYLAAFVIARAWFVGGLLALVGAAAFALAHRYVSSDCITCQVRYLRLKKVRDAALKDEIEEEKTARKCNQKMQEEKDQVELQLGRGGKTLLTATILLMLGVVLITMGFAKTIF